MPPGSSSSAKTSWAGRVKTQKEKQVRKTRPRCRCRERGLGKRGCDPEHSDNEEKPASDVRERKEQWGSGPANSDEAPLCQPPEEAGGWTVSERSAGSEGRIQDTPDKQLLPEACL